MGLFLLCLIVNDLHRNISKNLNVLVHSILSKTDLNISVTMSLFFRLQRIREQGVLVVSLRESVLDCTLPGHIKMNWKITLFLKYKELI